VSKRLPDDVVLAREEFTAMAGVLDAHMHGRQFVVGNTATVADFVLAYTLDWGQRGAAAGRISASARLYGAHVRQAARTAADCRGLRSPQAGSLRRMRGIRAARKESRIAICLGRPSRTARPTSTTSTPRNQYRTRPSRLCRQGSSKPREGAVPEDAVSMRIPRETPDFPKETKACARAKASAIRSGARGLAYMRSI